MFVSQIKFEWKVKNQQLGPPTGIGQCDSQLKEFPPSLMVADGNPSAFSQIQKVGKHPIGSGVMHVSTKDMLIYWIRN